MMKNKLISCFIISLLLSVSVSAADVSTSDDTGNNEPELRVAEVLIPNETVELEGAEEIVKDIADIIEITEAKYTNESGFSLWYNYDTLKPAEYGGQLCFIPVEEDDALKSSSVIIVVPNEPGETPSPLEEVTAMYPEESISQMEVISSDSGILIESVEVIDEGKVNSFYIVSYEDLSLNITSIISEENAELYKDDFQRLVESISFEKTVTIID